MFSVRWGQSTQFGEKCPGLRENFSLGREECLCECTVRDWGGICIGSVLDVE